MRMGCGVLLFLGFAMGASQLLASEGAIRGGESLIDSYGETMEYRKALAPVQEWNDSARTRFREVQTRELVLWSLIHDLVLPGDDISEIVKYRVKEQLGETVSESIRPEPDLAVAVVEAAGGVVLEGPVHGSPIRARLSPGDRLRIDGSTKNWYRVLLVETGRGWVHASLVGRVADDGGGDIPGYVRINDQDPTYYHTAREAGFPVRGPLYGHDYDGTERRTIQAPDGHALAETSGRYFALLLMQGSGILEDGRGVSYASNRRFEIMPEGCKGITATGNWVVPFHTFAVNRREMPYREVYFVPRSVGLLLPNGEVHDGFWFAHDTGGAFQGTPRHRTDMYVDRAEWVGWMETHLVPSHGRIEVYRVDRETHREVYEKYKDQLGPSMPSMRRDS